MYDAELKLDDTLCAEFLSDSWFVREHVAANAFKCATCGTNSTIIWYLGPNNINLRYTRTGSLRRLKRDKMVLVRVCAGCSKRPDPSQHTPAYRAGPYKEALCDLCANSKHVSLYFLHEYQCYS
jgi:hypothetical protein